MRPALPLAPRLPRAAQPMQPAPNPRWLARGMVALFDCRLGRELISGDRAQTNTAHLTGRSDGVAPRFNGTTHQVYPHRPSYVLNGPLSIVIYCDIDSLTNYSHVIGKQSSTTSNGYELRLGTGATDGRLHFIRAHASGLYAWEGPSNLVAAGQRGALIVISDPTSTLEGAGKTAFVNGKATALVTSWAQSTGAAADAGANVFIGRRTDGATQLDGGIYWIALFNRAWDDQMNADLAANRWDLFLGQRRRQPWWGGGVAQALGVIRSRAVALLMRAFRQHQPYVAPGAWTPAQLFTPGTRGFWLDFTDPTKRLNSSGTQALSGDFVRTLIPSAGTATNFTTPNNGPLARDGYIDFAPQGILTGTTDFRETSGGGVTALAMFTEPAPSSGQVYATLDARHAGQETLSFVWNDQGPYFQLFAHNADGSVNYFYDSYARVAGRRRTYLFSGPPSNIDAWCDGVAAGRATKNSTTPDRTGVSFAIGASYWGGTGPGVGGYTGRGYHAIVLDRPLATAEIQSLNTWAAAVA